MILKTIEQVQRALTKIINARGVKAAASEYDRDVFIDAVAAARKTIDSVSTTGSPKSYHKTVQSRLDHLLDNYNDTAGQYTNGRAAIGDVLSDISELSISPD